MGNRSENYAVFERNMAEEIERGAIVRLFARGAQKGAQPVEGWYIMLQRPDGRYLLLLNSRDATVKFIKTVIALFKLLNRTKAPKVTVPLEAQVTGNKDTWDLHALLNREAALKELGNSLEGDDTVKAGG